MKFRLSCVIDANLIGPLTELIAPYGQVSIKAVEDGAPPSKPKSVPLEAVPRRIIRRSADLLPTKGLGTIAVLRAVSKEMTLPEIKAEMAKINLNPDGSGATLSKLRTRGYVRNPAEAMWRLTPKGETAVRRFADVILTPRETKNAAPAK